ncbi:MULTISPECIES: cell division protein ZapA [unclassified Luteimonas]
MSADSEPVSVRILDREYTIGVGSDGREALMAAARLLDAKMREIRGTSRMASVDRVAVLAALNLAHELEQLRERDLEVERVLGTLERKLHGAGID